MPKLVSILLSAPFIFLWLMSEREMAINSDDFLRMFYLFMGVVTVMFIRGAVQGSGLGGACSIKATLFSKCDTFSLHFNSNLRISFSLLIWRSNDLFPIFRYLFDYFCKALRLLPFRKANITFLGVAIFAALINRPTDQILGVINFTTFIICLFVPSAWWPAGYVGQLFDRPKTGYYGLDTRHYDLISISVFFFFLMKLVEFLSPDLDLLLGGIGFWCDLHYSICEIIYCDLVLTFDDGGTGNPLFIFLLVLFFSALSIWLI